MAAQTHATSTTFNFRSVGTTVVAILGSLLLNVGGLCAIALFLVLQMMARQMDRPTEEANEVVISLEELLPETLDPEEPAKKSYIDTFQNQVTGEKPKKPAFESDKDTIAATDMLPTEKSDLLVPTQDGKESPLENITLQEHKYVDGPEGEIAKSVEATAGIPVPPSPVMKLPKEETLKPELMAEVLPKTEATERKEITDPREQEQIENPDKMRDEVAEKRDERYGEQEGGMHEAIEMAKLDLPSQQESFSDAEDILDQRTEAPDLNQDAMPERSPVVTDPTNPIFAVPKPRPSAPLVAMPISEPQQTAALPAVPGSIASRQSNGSADLAAFSPSRVKNKVNGQLSNLGRDPSVDAEATPLGRYIKAVNEAVERRWHILRLENASYVSFSSLKLKFNVNSQGNTSNLRVSHNKAGAVVTSFSLQAVKEAEIPAMPDEIADLLGDELLEVTYDIIIY